MEEKWNEIVFLNGTPSQSLIYAATSKGHITITREHIIRSTVYPNNAEAVKLPKTQVSSTNLMMYYQTMPTKCVSTCSYKHKIGSKSQGLRIQKRQQFSWKLIFLECYQLKEMNHIATYKKFIHITRCLNPCLFFQRTS
jgi:hypothetical protein